MIDSLSLTFVGQILAAFIGTAAFAILFGVPEKQYGVCGITGAIGWSLYLVLLRYAGASSVEATFFAALLVSVVSRIAARLSACPSTIFLICGIFPLVPGGGIFWTAYYFVASKPTLALQSGFLAIKLVTAIVLGILIVMEIPERFFTLRPSPGRR